MHTATRATANILHLLHVYLPLIKSYPCAKRVAGDLRIKYE